MKILRIEFNHLSHFSNGNCSIDFIAMDRVIRNSGLYQIARGVHTQNIIALVGLNATGKTTVLRLLNASLHIVIDNMDLNIAFGGNRMIQDGTLMRVLFFYDNNYYLLESEIGVRETDGKQELYYKDEVLSTKSKAQIRSKNDLNNFLNNPQSSKKRSTLDASIYPFLKKSISIVVSVTQGNNCQVNEYLILNHVNLVNTLGCTPHEVLDVFDESIESFVVEPQSEGLHCKVKFKHDSYVYDVTDMLRLNNIVSAGTIKGQGLIGLAANALHTGGYLLVDELEAHLNKELVRVILDLFKDPSTNPKGACLVFSTHYAELLDLVNRKDNIYITRKKKQSSLIK